MWLTDPLPAAQAMVPSTLLSNPVVTAARPLPFDALKSHWPMALASANFMRA
jgi:hypothetical protein